jgi:hypothetical protein
VTLVYDILVILHFLGLAALIGGFLVQITSSPRIVNRAMVDGAWTQLVTGVLLVGLRYPLHESDGWELPNNAKIGVKLAILLVIVGLVMVNRKKESISAAVWGLIGGLAIVNVAIAVLW